MPSVNQFTDPIFLIQKGQPSGVATLDVAGKVPIIQLPISATAPMSFSTTTGVISIDLSNYYTKAELISPASSLVNFTNIGGLSGPTLIGRYTNNTGTGETISIGVGLNLSAGGVLTNTGIISMPNLQQVTTAGNESSNFIRITGDAGPVGSGAALELQQSGGVGFLQAYNRTSSSYIPLVLGAGTSVKTNVDNVTQQEVFPTGITKGTFGFNGKGLMVTGSSDGIDYNTLVDSVAGRSILIFNDDLTTPGTVKPSIYAIDNDGTEALATTLDISASTLTINTFNLVLNNTGGQFVQIIVGTGSPEGIIVAAPGSLFLSTAGAMYLKTTGTGSTGWTLK